MCDFSVDYRAFDTTNIINIHKYLTKKHNVKYLSLLKKNVYWIINYHISASNYTIRMLLSHHKCMTQHTVVKLHPNEYSQELLIFICS